MRRRSGRREGGREGRKDGGRDCLHLRNPERRRAIRGGQGREREKEEKETERAKQRNVDSKVMKEK